MNAPQCYVILVPTLPALFLPLSQQNLYGEAGLWMGDIQSDKPNL